MRRTDNTVSIMAMCAIVFSITGLVFTTFGAFDVDPVAPAWQDRVSREPMWLIVAGDGSRDDPLGLAEWWESPGGVGGLLDRIEEGYQHGARRFFISRPMGSDGASDVPGASWLTIERAKRGELVDALAHTILDRYDEPVDLVWYVGSDLRDPRDIRGWHSADAASYYLVGDTTTPDRQYAARATLGGWISTGAAGIAFNDSATSDKVDHFIQLAESLRNDPFNIDVYGEAIPFRREPGGDVLRDDVGHPVVDAEALHAMPWIATESFLDRQFDGPEFRAHPSFARVFVWFDRPPGTRTDIEARDAAQDAVRRGLIPITNDPRIFGVAMDIHRLIDGTAPND